MKELTLLVTQQQCCLYVKHKYFPNVFVSLILNLVIRGCCSMCDLWSVESRISPYGLPATLFYFMPRPLEILSKVLFEFPIHSNCHLSLILWATPSRVLFFLPCVVIKTKPTFLQISFSCVLQISFILPYESIFIGQNILWGTVLGLQFLFSMSLLSKDSKEKQFFFDFSNWKNDKM